ncbi:MAG: phosphopantetheine adenylyltransferase [Myxococcota bacterium]
MTEAMVVVTLGISMIIHVIPVSGVLGGGRLEALYGVRVVDPGVLLAMRHRAVMFGLLAGLLGLGLFDASLRPVAIATTFTSDLAFLVLAVGVPVDAAMRRVVVADVVSLGCLAIASVGLALA